MISSDDFRFTAHKLLLELDASTTRLMMLVVSGEVSGDEWVEALSHQKLAFDKWSALSIPIHTDPIPALDSRP